MTTETPVKEHTVTLTETEYQRNLNATCFAGSAAAYENAAKILRQKSGEMFAADKDSLAKFARDLAKEFDELAVKSRDVQRRNETDNM